MAKKLTIDSWNSGTVGRKDTLSSCSKATRL